MRLAKILNEDPGAIHAGDLTNLRRQVEKLVSLIENQLYCIAGSPASTFPTTRRYSNLTARRTFKTWYQK